MEKSLVVKRSIVFGGHKTSVSLEDAFWNGLRDIADEHDMTLSALISNINADRDFANLSSAIRLFVLGTYQKQMSELASAEPVDVKPVKLRRKLSWGARWGQYERLRARRGSARSPSQA